jgi:hypothetical protein
MRLRESTGTYYSPKMIMRSPLRYFRTSPELQELAVMLYLSALL